MGADDFAGGSARRCCGRQARVHRPGSGPGTAARRNSRLRGALARKLGPRRSGVVAMASGASPVATMVEELRLAGDDEVSTPAHTALSTA